MAKWNIDLSDNDIESAVNALMNDLDEELVLGDSEMQEELVGQLHARIGEIEGDVQAGLERPEFEKAIEDAKQRIQRALRDAFSYKRR